MDEAPTSVDHYDTLGVTPRSEDVVIRAAYLALMRRHHPDKSSTPASAERARAIIAAFAVLGDVERRTQYDWDRRRAAEQLAHAARPRLATLPRAMMAVALALLVGIPLLIAGTRDASDPQAPPTAQRRDPVAPPARAEPSPMARAVPVEPVPLAPPPVAAALPDTLPEARDTPDKPAAIKAQAELPTQTRKIAPLAAKVQRPPAAVPDRRLARAEAKPAKPVARANAKCQSARPGADRALCQNENLAALDGLAVAYYGQSLRVGNATKRAALVVSRGDLLGRREACRSDACLRSAYLVHMREISAIVENKPRTAQ